MFALFYLDRLPRCGTKQSRSLRHSATAPPKFPLFYSTKCNYITHDISLEHAIVHGTTVMVVVVLIYSQFCIGNAVSGVGKFLAL